VRVLCRTYVQRGLIPYVRIQSNLRFLRSDVLAWVEEHRSGLKSKGHLGARITLSASVGVCLVSISIEHEGDLRDWIDVIDCG
jgi:hypothetical protein